MMAHTTHHTAARLITNGSALLLIALHPCYDPIDRTSLLIRCYLLYMRLHHHEATEISNDSASRFIVLHPSSALALAFSLDESGSIVLHCWP